MVEEEIKRLMKKNGFDVEKILLFHTDDVDAKYIKKYEGFIKLRMIYVGVMIVDGAQVPFIAQCYKHKLHVFLYPQRDFYLAHLVDEC